MRRVPRTRGKAIAPPQAGSPFLFPLFPSVTPLVSFCLLFSSDEGGINETRRSVIVPIRFLVRNYWIPDLLNLDCGFRMSKFQPRFEFPRIACANQARPKKSVDQLPTTD